MKIYTRFWQRWHYPEGNRQYCRCFVIIIYGVSYNVDADFLIGAAIKVRLQWNGSSQKTPSFSKKQKHNHIICAYGVMRRSEIEIVALTKNGFLIIMQLKTHKLMNLYKTLRVTVPIDIIIKTSIWRRAKLVLILIPNLGFTHLIWNHWQLSGL